MVARCGNPYFSILFQCDVFRSFSTDIKTIWSLCFGALSSCASIIIVILSNAFLLVFIFIYRQRDRAKERERERKRDAYVSMCALGCVCSFYLYSNRNAYAVSCMSNCIHSQLVSVIKSHLCIFLCRHPPVFSFDLFLFSYFSDFSFGARNTWPYSIRCRSRMCTNAILLSISGILQNQSFFPNDD